MYDIPESDIVGVRVDEEAVKINKNPEYIHSRPSASSDDHPNENASKSNTKKTETDLENKISMPTG